MLFVALAEKTTTGFAGNKEYGSGPFVCCFGLLRGKRQDKIFIQGQNVFIQTQMLLLLELLLKLLLELLLLLLHVFTI